MTYETILVEVVDSVSVMTMNRPERLNAWTPKMGAELSEAIQLANEDDDVVAMADNEAVLADADPPPRWVRVEGAGHFFHGQLAIIKSTTVEFLEGLAI